MLNYLAHGTRSDVMISVHQCARFCKDPKLSHQKVVKIVVKHLIGTNHAGIEVTVGFNKGLVAFDDSDFANGWNKLDVYNIDNIFSRIRHIICMFGFPIT